MVAIPPALLDVTHLAAGKQVAVSIEGGRLILEPQDGPRYTLEGLLAQCDSTAPMSAEDRDWLDSAPVGSELL
jgi:antitoxin ChpS